MESAATDLNQGFSHFLDAAREAEAILRSHPEANAETLADAHVYLAGMWHFYLTRAFKGADLDRPCFVRDMESFRSWGLPTPNHHYYSAEIDGEGEYRILCQRGNTVDYCFELLSGLAGDDGVVGDRTGALESSNLEIGPDGRFELYLGGAHRASNWMKSSPNARVIFVRQTVSDWAVEQPTPMLIERIDRPPGPFLRPSAAEVDALYRRAARGLVNQVKWLQAFALNWSKVLPLNELIPPAVGPADAGFFPGQFNTRCRWEIDEDEGLLVSFKPPSALYQSLDLAHPLWFNSIYPRDVASSLTAAQSSLSTDGAYRYVISAADPGVPNWLDTAGLTRGFLFIRWQRVTGAPPETPSVQRVKLAALRDYLPADQPLVTAEARAKAARSRRLSMDRRYA